MKVPYYNGKKACLASTRAGRFRAAMRGVLAKPASAAAQGSVSLGVRHA
jgi:hypothetical protein